MWKELCLEVSLYLFFALQGPLTALYHLPIWTWPPYGSHQSFSCSTPSAWMMGGLMLLESVLSILAIVNRVKGDHRRDSFYFIVHILGCVCSLNWLIQTYFMVFLVLGLPPLPVPT